VPRDCNIPYEFLSKASVLTLESFELSRLNHAANLKKQINQLVEQWLDESAAALLARAMILRINRMKTQHANRQRQLQEPRSVCRITAVPRAKVHCAPAEPAFFKSEILVRSHAR